MGFILVFILVYLGAWQIASHVPLPIRRIFIPKIFESET
jgi:hypothetical protein